MQEHNEALRKALELKKAELSQALAAARQTSPPPEAAPADDPLTEKVSVMEQKAKSLAQQLHGKVCHTSMTLPAACTWLVGSVSTHPGPTNPSMSHDT